MSEPVYQTAPVDYEELIAGLESNLYPPSLPRHTEEKKRFLGERQFCIYEPLVTCPVYLIPSRHLKLSTAIRTISPENEEPS